MAPIKIPKSNARG